MTMAQAAFKVILTAVPCVYFDVDLGDDLSWRIMLSTQTEHDTSKDEDHLEDIRAFAKKGTPAFRMDMFDDDKGWSDKNPAKDKDGEVIKGREPTQTETTARYHNEPATRKRNPEIAAFVKAHKRLPRAQDTFNLKAAGDILIPTTYRPQGEARYTGKYSAPMNATLTQEQWDAVPEHQKSRQNCVYELLHTSDITIDATAIETPVMEDTPQPVTTRKRW